MASNLAQRICAATVARMPISRPVLVVLALLSSGCITREGLLKKRSLDLYQGMPAAAAEKAMGFKIDNKGALVCHNGSGETFKCETWEYGYNTTGGPWKMFRLVFSGPAGAPREEYEQHMSLVNWGWSDAPEGSHPW